MITSRCDYPVRRAAVWLLSFVLLGGGVASAGGSSDARPVPAATFSQFQCTGFIASEQLNGDIRVFNGSDNDLDEPLHQFVPGDYVYLRGVGQQQFQAGEAYSTVRPETGSTLSPTWHPGKLENQILPPASWYTLQRYDIRKLGWPYNNTGLVRVVKVRPQGAIARVVFSCNGIEAQDIAVPYTPQPIPEYTPPASLARFAPPNGKLRGLIVASPASSAYLARGSIAFLDIGSNQGVAPGQQYRVYAIFRNKLVRGFQGLIPLAPETPRETLGELVILRVEPKSSVAIVVRSLREMAVGDGVELE
ncbi:MAG: hypothetical protein ACRD1N_07325 [Terriglobia bacterium]